MKPTNLPKDWIVVTSKTHPNRVYYFNVKTNKSSWDVPVDEPDDGARSKKRKKSTDDEVKHRPTTPELEVQKKAKGEERVTLRARRSIVPADKKNDAQKQSALAAGPKETPQMRELRLKMLERQSKGNAPRRSKVIAPPIENPEEPVVEKAKEIPTPSKPPEKSPETKILTPQMRVLLEKLKARKAGGGALRSPAKSEDLGDAPQVAPLRRPRAISVASADLSSTADSSKVTRRSTRRSLNAVAASSTPTKRANIAKDNIPEEDEPPSEAQPAAVSARRVSTTKTSPRRAEKHVAETSSDSITPEKATKVPRLGRSAQLKKNLAEERLINLQKSFGEDKSVVDGPSPTATTKLPQNARILLHDVALEPAKDSPPSIYKNAELRMKLLHERLKNKAHYERRMRGNVVNANPTSEDTEDVAEASIANALNTSTDSFCEEMEWEPIEDDKIMQEIEVVRSVINTMDEDPKPREAPENSLDLTDGTCQTKQSKALYIVIDTNVFLSNIGAIEEARDAVFRTHGKPMIVVPWTVIRELDFIKDDKSMTRPECLRAKARQAVRFLHQHFSARHPRILGQTPMDVANNRQKFEVECPDDEILQTCLQIRLSNNCVVLLSYDKNLCNKAMIHDIATLGRHDPLEKVDYLHASEVRNESFLTQHLRGEEQDAEVVPIFVKELRMAEEILDGAQEVLTSFLSVVVAKEMQNLYNEHWEKYTIIRPPWTVYSVLKCAVKHWIAAVSESFTRRAEMILKQLLQAINKMPESGRQLRDVSHILEMINDLLQCVKVDKYTSITVRSGQAIAELRAKCVDAMQKIQEEKLQEDIGLRKNEEEARANAAFQQFEEAYAFARDMCGLASEAIGMPCSFPFKKFNPLPTIENVKAMQPDVAANINRLLQALSTALEELNSLHMDHRAVIALYDSLANFMPDQKGVQPRDFSPQDVYWCLKTKEKVLKSGLGQLQELSAHFCRMASFRCT